MRLYLGRGLTAMVSNRTKRLMFLTPSLSGGGAERVTSILASHMAKRADCDVMLVVFHRDDMQYPLADNVKVKYLCDSKKLSFLKRRSLIRRCLEDYCPTEVLSLASYYNFLFGTGIFNLVPVYLSQRVATNRRPNSIRDLLTQVYCRRCYARSSGVVFQTEDVKKCFSKRVQEKGTVIRNPIEVRVAGNPMRARDPVVVSFGRLTKQKNYPLLLEAFALFSREHPGYALRIFGDGPLSNELSTLVDTNYRALDISIEPAREDIHAIIKNCTMYVSSSDYEGLSNSLLESMLLGVPCISTDSLGGGARSIIDDGVNGFLVPRGDAKLLASRMSTLASDDNLQSSFAASGQRLADELNPDRICEEWLSFIEGNAVN